MATIDRDFIRQYVKSPESIILRDISGGNTVLKVPGFDVAIKFGGGVTMEEAVAQGIVYALLDQAVVRIPKVYHFYRDSQKNIGYLAMEWLDGAPIDLQDDIQSKALQKTIGYLASFPETFQDLFIMASRKVYFSKTALQAITKQSKG